MTREELYYKVWTTPLRTLAKEFGISDSTLGNKCKKHNVPKPKAGYWSKIRHGKKVKLPTLPVNNDPLLDNICITPSSATDIVIIKNELELLSEDPRVIKAQNFKFLSNVSSYHELIKNFRKEHSDRHTNRYGFVMPNYGSEPELDITVTRSSLSRVFKLLQGIISLFKKHKWALTTASYSYNDKSYACFIAEGEEVRFKVKEVVKQVPHVLTPKEIKSSYSYHQKYDYIPSGKLTFSLEGYWPGEKFCHKWIDKVNSPLEERLAEITKGFIITIKHTRNKRLESEEQDRQYAIAQEL